MWKSRGKANYLKWESNFNSEAQIELRYGKWNDLNLPDIFLIELIFE